MVLEAAQLVVWLIILFGIVSVFSWCLAIGVIRDSMNYDEQFVWQRKLSRSVRGEVKRKH